MGEKGKKLFKILVARSKLSYRFFLSSATCSTIFLQVVFDSFETNEVTTCNRTAGPKHYLGLSLSPRVTIVN